MIRILDILSGPYEQDGMVWLECRMTDGLGNDWIEEIYYDDMRDALDELEDFHMYGIVEIEDDLLDYDEEEGHDYD